jgi:cytochrome c peroxidase
MIKKVFFLFVSLWVFLLSMTDPETMTQVKLGERLFFDPILSKDSTLSCASCHKPDFAFADTVAISPGILGRIGRRNAPSVMNMASRSEFFYDGRAKSLRDQIHFPIEDPLEMDLSYGEAVERLKRNTYYKNYY